MEMERQRTSREGLRLAQGRSSVGFMGLRSRKMAASLTTLLVVLLFGCKSGGTNLAIAGGVTMGVGGVTAVSAGVRLVQSDTSPGLADGSGGTKLTIATITGGAILAVGAILLGTGIAVRRAELAEQEKNTQRPPVVATARAPDAVERNAPQAETEHWGLQPERAPKGETDHWDVQAERPPKETARSLPPGDAPGLFDECRDVPKKDVRFNCVAAVCDREWPSQRASRDCIKLLLQQEVADYLNGGESSLRGVESALVRRAKKAYGQWGEAVLPKIDGIACAEACGFDCRPDSGEMSRANQNLMMCRIVESFQEVGRFRAGKESEVDLHLQAIVRRGAMLAARRREKQIAARAAFQGLLRTRAAQCSDYDTKKNDILRSEVFREAQKQLRTVQIIERRGVLKVLSTDQGGSVARIELDARGATVLSRPIRRGTRVYKQLVDLGEGECVVFSADNLRANSLLERSKVCDPDFTARITTISRCR